MQISKHFLSNFLDVNVWKSDFTTIKDDFLKSIKFEELKEKPLLKEKILIYSSKEEVEEIENICQNELNFHKYICNKYLNLEKEPKDELLSVYGKIRCDIIEIDETLDDIQKQIDEITKNNKTDEIQEKKPILLYYQEHNKRVKDEILEFLKNDVENYALFNCYGNSIMRSIATSKLYNYFWKPNAYKPIYPNDLANKFSNLILVDFRYLCDKYENDKNAFRDYLKNYIKVNDIVYCIKNLINKHHLLPERNDLLVEALNVYENGAKIIFANAVPTIIEGILHDLCILSGENENELLSKGFQYKLDKLKDILSYELYYEYYSFKFRLFRNKVAHGRLNKSDDELPDLLLLDLYQICNLIFSTKIKLNQKRFVIKKSIKIYKI